MIKINNQNIIGAYYGSQRLSALAYQNNLFSFKEPIIEYVVAGTEAVSLALVEGKAADWREVHINNGDGTSTMKIYASTPPTRVCFFATARGDVWNSDQNDKKILRVDKFDGSRLTNAAYMFAHCTALTYVNTELFNTSSVSKFTDMFFNCKALSSLDATKINTTNATSLYGMFYQCTSLNTLNVGHFKTSKVTSFNGMFTGVPAATLDVSTWTTTNIDNIEYMFYNCKNLTSLNLGNWDLSNCKYMGYAFSGCSKLASLTIPSQKFITSKCTKANNLFQNCKALTEIYDLWFDFTNVTSLESFYEGCESLTHTYSYVWDVDNITNMNYMFKNCRSMKFHNVSDYGYFWCINWYTPNLTSAIEMLAGCEMLNIAYVDNMVFKRDCDITNIFKETNNLIAVQGGPSIASAINLMNAVEDKAYLEMVPVLDSDIAFFYITCPTLVAILAKEEYEPPTLTDDDYVALSQGLNSIIAKNWMFNVTAADKYNYMVVYIPANGTTFTLQTNRRGDTGDLQFVDWGDDSNIGIYLASGNYSHTYNTAGYYTIRTQLLPTHLTNNTVECATYIREYLALNTEMTDYTYAFLNNTNITKFRGDDIDYFSSDSTSFKNAFRHCTNLTEFYMNNRYDSVTDMAGMFYECPNLKTVHFKNFSAKSLKDINNICGGGDTSLTSFIIECTTSTSSPPVIGDQSVLVDFSNMFNGCSALTSLDLTWASTDKGNTKIGSISGICKGCTSLTTFPNILGWNMSTITNMYEAFYEIGKNASTKIPEISFYYADDTTTQPDVFWNWLSVTDVRRMFYGANIDTINLTAVQAPNATLMKNMVSYSTATGISFAAANFVSATDFAGLFTNCEQVTTIDLQYTNLFYSSNPASVKDLFYYCKSLVSIPGFAKALGQCYGGISDMSRMFYSCQSLQYLDFRVPLEEVDVNNTIVPIDTRPCTSMFRMFYNCNNMIYMDIGCFNTENVTNMEGMFRECTNLIIADLSSFEVPKLQNAKEMFYLCSKLSFLCMDRFRFTEEIIHPVGSENMLADMFSGCASLSSVQAMCVDKYSLMRLINQLDATIDEEYAPMINVSGVFYKDVVLYGLESIAKTGFISKTLEEFEALNWMLSPMTGVNVYEIGFDQYDYLLTDEMTVTLSTDLRGGSISSLTGELTMWGEWLYYILGDEGDRSNTAYDSSQASQAYTYKYPGRKYTIVTPCCTNPISTGNPITEVTRNKVKGIYSLITTATDWTYFARGLTSLEKVEVSEDYCTAINDYDNYVFSQATTTKDMFAGCTALKSVNMQLTLDDLFEATGMFYDCVSMTEFENSWTMSNGLFEWAEGTFRQCRSLKYVDLSTWNPYNLKGIHHMFNEANSMEVADLSNWHIPNVTHSDAFHWGSPRLNIYMDAVPYSSILTFVQKVNSITPCEGGAIYYEAPGDYDATAEDNIYTTARAKGWATTDPNYNVFTVSVSAGYTMNLLDNRRGDTTAIGVTDWGDGTIDTAVSHTYANAGNYIIKSKLGIHETYWYNGDHEERMSHVIAWHQLNKNITNYDYMFAYSNAAKYETTRWIKPSNSGSKVSSMFAYQKNPNLIKLDLTGFVNSNVTNAQYIVTNTDQVQTLICNDWDLSSLLYSPLLSGPSACTTLEVKNWKNVGNIANKSLSQTFAWFESVKEIDMSTWSGSDVRAITNFNSMFYQCYALTRLILPPGINYVSTSATYDKMFQDVNSLNYVSAPEGMGCSFLYNVIPTKSSSAHGTLHFDTIYSHEMDGITSQFANKYWDVVYDNVVAGDGGGA